jgi:GT2 family glycosyltransferase
MRTVDVIVPVLINSPEQIKMTLDCIKTARETTKVPFKLIIVETLTQHFKDLADVYVWEREKTTATISINRGFKVSNADWVILLTNDVFVKEGWIERLIECFAKHKDCGVATLATNQFNHKQEDKIEEGNWWSVVMIPKCLLNKVGYFDERFKGVWDDTDLLMRIYKASFKMYRNFNVVVDHLIGATHYENPQHKDNYSYGQRLFNEKHKDCGIPIFNTLK